MERTAASGATSRTPIVEKTFIANIGRPRRRAHSSSACPIFRDTAHPTIARYTGNGKLPFPAKCRAMRKNPVRRLERILWLDASGRSPRKKGVPVSHLADRAGVSRSLLWEIFSLTASVSLETVQKLADALALDDPLELLRGTPAMVRKRQPAAATARKARAKSKGAR